LAVKVQRALGRFFFALIVLGGARHAHAQATPNSEVPTAEHVAHQELTRKLTITRDHLRSQNHRFQVPVVGLAVGIASVVTGGILLIMSQEFQDEDCDLPCDGDDVSSYPMRRAGQGLLPVGALLIAVSQPTMVVRVVRHARLKRIERQLRWLGSHATLHPQLRAREQLGLSARLRF
jgi:hypothetical protein